MNWGDLGVALAVVAGYLFLTSVVLPRLGVPT